MVSLRSHLAGGAAAMMIWLSGVTGNCQSSVDAQDNALLDRWFAAQSQLKTWSADLVQTRRLKALKQPLQTPGRVWFSSPNQFRWEVGDPVQTIAVRESDALVVLYPRLKRAERYPLNNVAAGRWRDALTLLESGFPRSREELERDFDITAMQVEEGRAAFTMVPKSAETRRMLQAVVIGFSSSDLLLRSTELRFADESVMRNEFSDIRVNPSLTGDLFKADVAADFKLSEPLTEN